MLKLFEGEKRGRDKLFFCQEEDAHRACERKRELQETISRKLGIALNEAAYFIATPGIERNMYDEADDSIDILYNDGTIRNIADASDMLNISVLSKKVRKFYFCYQRLNWKTGWRVFLFYVMYVWYALCMSVLSIKETANSG